METKKRENGMTLLAQEAALLLFASDQFKWE